MLYLWEWECGASFWRFYASVLCQVSNNNENNMEPTKKQKQNPEDKERIRRK